MTSTEAEPWLLLVVFGSISISPLLVFVSLHIGETGDFFRSLPKKIIHKHIQKRVASLQQQLFTFCDELGLGMEYHGDVRAYRIWCPRCKQEFQLSRELIEDIAILRKTLNDRDKAMVMTAMRGHCQDVGVVQSSALSITQTHSHHLIYYCKTCGKEIYYGDLYTRCSKCGEIFCCDCSDHIAEEWFCNSCYKEEIGTKKKQQPLTVRKLILRRGNGTRKHAPQ